MNRLVVGGLAVCALLAGCSGVTRDRQTSDNLGAGSFGDDVRFLDAHTSTVVLQDGDARVVIAPAWQGRVMTSTAGGDAGTSYGWINRSFIEKGELVPHMNVFGGEERFWMGPEGGQFSIYFPEGKPFEFEHWQVPAFIDTEPFSLTSHSDRSATFAGSADLTNWSGTRFLVGVDRTVRLLSPVETSSMLGVALPRGVHAVAYESINGVTNRGREAWKKDTGLLSVWMLCMFTPGPKTTVVIPFVQGEESQLGPVYNDSYFGAAPADWLVVDDGVIFFRCDGEYRTKIGIKPSRVKPTAGSWDAARGVLTFVQFNKPAGATDYVNSEWREQDEPYAGDVVNSYNDGPTGPGQPPLGPFYEIETSSPALALKPGERAVHIERVMHFEGDRAALDQIAEKVLGVGLDRIEGVFAGN